MSEWIRHRGSKGMPKRLEGKYYEAMRRDGTIAAFVNSWLHCGRDSDVLKYRITGNIAPPDYSKGFPVGTTAKDIGAKVGDSFLVISNKDKYFQKGQIAKLAKDDESEVPFFSIDGTYNELDRHCLFWYELAPIPQKTAIELQAEKVGIPEPVQLVDDDVHLGIKRPDGDGWVKYNAGDVVDLDGVVSIDWVNVRGNAHTAKAPRELMWGDGEDRQIAWYRLNRGEETDTSQKRVENEEEIVHIPTTAPEFLQSALNTLTQRGKDYDKPVGERSAAAVAVAFNAITGRNLTEAEVWLILQLVKDVRQWQNPGRYHADSALDCVAYAALKAEALARK